MKKISEIQKQFWLVNKVSENNLAYNIPLCNRIEGALDINLFKETWYKFLEQVPDLCVSFNSGDTGIEYTSVKSENIPISEKSIQDLPKIQKYLHEFINREFDLERCVPIRAVLVEMSADEHYFLVVFHHIVMDLYIKELITELFSDLYNTGSSGICFIEKDNDHHPAGNYQIRSFWKNYLENPPSPLVLPSSHIRAPFSGNGNNLYMKIPDKINEKIRGIVNEEGYQPFLILLTAYTVLLSKLSGEEEFLLGVPFTNRKGEKSKKICSPRVNILPLRIKIEEDYRFSSLYLYIRKQMLLLHRNQEIPFTEIARIYSGERNKDIPFFIQAGFTREEPFLLKLKDLKCSPVPLRPDGAQMDLFMTYWEVEGEIRYRFEYNTDAFSMEQIHSAASSFEMLLDIFSSEQDKRLSAVSLVNSIEYSRYRQYYKQHVKEYPVEISFNELVNQSCKLHADKTALKDIHTSLTYSEFNLMVNSYASYLRNIVGTGKRIAVIMDASIDRIVLIHSIVFSGNSYIPVDKRWPGTRIKYILADSDAALTVIDNPDLYEKIGEVKRILFADIKPTEPGQAIYRTVSDDNFAVLYTSGTTGEPKGVSISVKGIINRLYWMQETFPLNPDSNLIHKVPYTFDVSIWEIFWPFLFGASLYIPEPGIHLDDALLAEIIKREKITYIHFVPSLLRNFLKNGIDKNFPDLEGVICSGEALEVPLVAEFHDKMPGKAIHNLYGPTEASIDVTSLTYVDETEFNDQIPIGYPISNTRIYILDKYKNLCPPFVRGEIAIAGICLSHGYLNNEEQTNASFIQGDWGWGDETVYLTGDHGYSEPDLLIFYNGRKDSQVKINGIRIELSEIEKRIEKLPYIKKAVVMITEKTESPLQIGAYIYCREQVEIEKMRADLSMFLPGYMIPHKFYFLNKFPVSKNGKIDRKQLLGMDFSDSNLNKVSKTEATVNRREKMMNNIRRTRNIRTIR